MIPGNIGGYRIKEKLGAGGMGEVYRGWDEHLNRSVAIKRIRTDLLDSAKARQRFKREALMVGQLNHPAIVRIHHVLFEEGQSYIVMEYVEGKTLASLLKEGPLPYDEALPLLRDVASGLAEAHRHDLVHRDLKAENVMVDSSGQAKILDFGLAKQLKASEHSLSAEGAILGTLHSMSPEQAQGRDLDHRSDLFSLGVLCYQTLTGKAPFRAGDPRLTLARVIGVRQQSLQEVAPDLPESISDLVDHLLEKDPACRPGSSDEVVEVLSGILSTSHQAIRPITRNSPPTLSRETRSFDSGRVTDVLPRRRQRLGLGALAVSILCLAIAAFWLSMRTPDPVYIALWGFENETGDSEKAWLGGAVAEVLAAGLERTGPLQRIRGDRVEEVRRGLGRKYPGKSILAPENQRELLEALGADYLVVGSYLAELEAISFQARLVNGKKDIALEADGPPDSPLQLGLDLADQARQALGGDILSPSDRHSLETLFPTRFAAWKPYADGVTAHLSGHPLNARDFFLQALDEEQENPILHLMFARVQRNLGAAEAATAAALEAERLAASLPLREQEKIQAFIDGVYLDHEAAAQRYQSLFEASGRFDDGQAWIFHQIQNGDYEAASRSLAEVRPLVRDLGAEEGFLDLFEAMIVQGQNDPENALDLVEKAIWQSEQSYSPSLKAEALLFRSSIFEAQGDYEQALKDATDAMHLFYQTGAQDNVSHTFMMQINIVARRGDLSDVRSAFEDFKALYTDWQYPYGIAVAGANIAIVLSEIGEFEEAMTRARVAYETFQEMGLQPEQAMTILALGATYHRIGRLAEAEELYLQVKSFSDLPDWLLGHAYVNLGEISFLKGDLASARGNYDTALELHADIEGSLAYDTMRLAELLAAQGEKDRARELLEEVVRGQEERGERDLILTLLTRAELRLQWQNPGNAEEDAVRAEQLSLSEGMNEEAVLARVLQSRALLAKSPPENAKARELVRMDLMRVEDLRQPHVRWMTQMLAARLAATGEDSDPDRAFMLLDEVVSSSVGLNQKDFFEAHLTMAELVMDGHGTEDRREQVLQGLKMVEEEARRLGWQWVVNHAVSLREAGFES